MEYDRNLFGEIQKFIKIRILDSEYEVPDRLELLRVFQFLDFSIDYARLCWNGSCKRCVVKFENLQNGKEGESLSCRLKSSEGLCLSRLPPTVKPKPPED